MSEAAVIAAAVPPAATTGTTSAAAGPGATPATFAPGETRMFANMMQGVQQPESAARGAIGDAVKAMATQLNGMRSVEDMRASMLASIDMNDPFKTMVMVADQSMQAQMSFSKLHMSTALASAATNLFGTLLKNQQ